MKPKTARVLRNIVITIVSFLAFLIIAIVAVVNLVLTNGRLMPIIKDYAHEYLDADVHIGHAEGTFFRSFPYIGVALDSCVVVTNSFHHAPALLSDSVAPVPDSLRMRRDTLAQIDRVIVGVDLFRYLLNDSNGLRLGLVALERPRVALITDSAGRQGWDIVRPTPPDELQDTTSSSLNLSVGHIFINNARIAYFNRPDEMGLFADSLSLNVDGNLALDKFNAKIDFDTRSLSAGKKATRFLQHKPLRIVGSLAYDPDSARFDLSNLALNLKNVNLNLDGWIRPDSTGADIDVRYAVDSPSADKIFEAIPKSLISSDIVIKQGAVDLKGFARGRASATELPVISGKAYIDKVRAQYVGQPDEIEDLTADFNLLIDKSTPDSSYVSLDIFHFKGGESEVTAVIRVTRLLAKALLECQLNAHVDLDNLQRVIPFDDTKMSGIVDADFHACVSLADVYRKNFGAARLNGKVNVDNLCITNDSTGLDIDVNANLNMATDQVIKVSSSLSSLKVKAGDMNLDVRDGKATVTSAFRKDTTHVAPLAGDISVSRAFFKADSIVVFAKNIHAVDHIDPQPSDPTLPMAGHDLKIDTIFAGIIGNRAFLNGLHLSADQVVVNDTTWRTKALAEYAHLGVRTPYFNIPVKTSNLRLTLDDDSVALVNCDVQAGRSSFKASGHVGKLFSSLRNRKPLTVSLATDADTIDCNEILAAIVMDSTTIANTSSIAIDTTTISVSQDSLNIMGPDIPQSMILVPRHVSLNVQTRAKALIWDQLTLTNIRGGVKTQGGAAHMTNLTFNINDAKVITTLAYKAWPFARKARANIFSRWDDADIETLVSALHLDSLVPAIKPMRGKLMCAMAAEVELDSLMNVVPSTARAAIHLSGQKLTLMDSESFKKIGKKLMFKNKERNVIDTLTLNVLLDSGRVQVLPTVINIDRYRMAVGGTQDLDMNMNYHVSILKSPLPFKAGVNITGTPENFDVDITTAKLKKQVTPEKLAKNDTISLLMRMTVLRNSYLLSGLPVPKPISDLVGNDTNTNFAVQISIDEATEEEKLEAERARREQMRQSAASDSTAVATPDSLVSTTDSTTISYLP